MLNGPITAAAVCPTNAQLIADYVQPLYLNDNQLIMDVTYGRGKWWKLWTPKNFIKHDLITLDGVDFTNLPEADESIDVVIFDPPYVCSGGQKSSTKQDFQNRYGIDTNPKTPEAVRKLIKDGMEEAYRVLKPGGLIMVKCANYVSSASYIPGVHWALTDAQAIGYTVVTQFIHVSGIGPQPTLKKNGEPRRVLSPRSNYSVLLVLRKKKCSLGSEQS